MKYYPLSPPVSTASQILVNDFNSMAAIEFYMASNVYTIQRETSFSSGVFSDVTVRIARAINNITSEKLSDDFKQILFNPNDNITDGIGHIYSFSDNKWLCVLSDKIKSIMSDITVRRCNNMLKWIDDNNILRQEPCIIDYSILGSRNLDRQDDLSLPQGYTNIFCQLNDRTERIKPNQRFLVGRPNRQVCWRVLGNGEMLSQGLQTTDNSSARLIKLTVAAYQYNEETDDLVNGIADYYKNIYTINLSASSISGNVGEIYPLGATLEMNGSPTSGSLTYTTSASTIATISSSGSLTLSQSGSSIATAIMGGNLTITASALVTVTASGTTTTEVRVTPSDNVEILEGDTQIFTTYLYANGVQQANIFTFAAANTNVPTDHYIMITNNNGFSVENVEKYLDLPLIITATTGSYTKQISITLNGAF